MTVEMKKLNDLSVVIDKQDAEIQKDLEHLRSLLLQTVDRRPLRRSGYVVLVGIV